MSRINLETKNNQVFIEVPIRFGNASDAQKVIRLLADANPRYSRTPLASMLLHRVSKRLAYLYAAKIPQVSKVSTMKLTFLKV